MSIRREKCAALLLQHKADPNIANANNHGHGTPLLTTCQNEDYKFASLLLKYNADLNVASKDNDTPLMVACTHDRECLIVYYCNIMLIQT